MLGTGLLPVAASRGCSSLWCGLLAAVVSPVAERGLTNCGPQAQLLHGVWNLPRPGLKPTSPALAGEFLSIASPGKSLFLEFMTPKF